MKAFDLEKRVNEDFYLTYLGFVKITQKKENPVFSSIGKPKKQDLLLFVHDCETRYFVKDGRQLSTKSGDVVYVPKGSEYKVECVKNGENGATLQVNFLLYDEEFRPFVFTDDLSIYTPQTPAIRTAFEKLMMFDKSSRSLLSQKVVLLEILSTIAEENATQKNNPVIQKGVEYLLAHYDENPPVSKLAQESHICEEYFRKIFKKQTGKTPTEYKNELRLEKAKHYLLYSDLSVEELSERLSYATVSHFIKCFKSAYGVSPLSYRNQFKRD